MSGSDLDTELRRSADWTAEAILSEARTEAERIASEANRSIEDRRRERLEDKEAEYGADARRAIAAERHVAMRAVLLARTRVVERVLERARTLLPEAARTDAYLSALGGELTEALQFVDGDGALVRCSPALESSVRKALQDRPEVRVEAEAVSGTGFTVVGGAEAVVVDGRLETRMDRLASSFAIEIHSRLQEA
jgi:vacuolar-type H+-ATPase subunit E/Vma4